MVYKGMNILEQHSKKQLIFNGEIKRVDFLDRRFYQRSPDEFYTSVTTILQYMPKAKFFENWLKDVGHNADIIIEKAGKEGTQVHDAVERLVRGEEISWMDQYGNAIYSLVVWEMILKFYEFWTTYKPKLILSEEFVYSDIHKYAGTLDLVVELEGENWLLDVKTSNNLSKSHELQLAAYAKALEEIKGIKIQKMGILWLKALTRGESKAKGVMQGKGWQVKIVEGIEENFELFKMIQKLYDLDNPDKKPAFYSYPTSIKI